MRAYLYINNDKIGEVNFSVTDESMGGIDGDLIANANSSLHHPLFFNQLNFKILIT
jgi:hypothetical protein